MSSASLFQLRHASQRRLRQFRCIRRSFRNWPTVAAAGLLWKLLPLPTREITLVTRGGTRLHAPLHRDAGALYTVLEVMAFGNYAHRWDLGRCPFIIDIGANVGSLALWVAERCGGVRGFCYEPDADAFGYLRRNLQTNRLWGVRPIEEAVSDRDGTSLLYRSAGANGVSSLFVNNPMHKPTESTSVSTIAFDRVMTGVDSSVALLKLDAEGAEYPIILGSNQRSWSKIQKVVVEHHPIPGQDPSRLIERLQDLGFAVVRRHALGPGIGLVWFSRSASLPEIT